MPQGAWNRSVFMAPLSVGFYAGTPDAALAGGIAPYTDRVAEVLRARAFAKGLEVSLIGGETGGKVCAEGVRELPLPEAVRPGAAAKAGRRLQEAWCVLTNKGAALERLPKPRTALGDLLRREGIDLLHLPYFVELPEVPVPYIVTIHDVQEIHFPQYFSAEDRRYRAIHYLKAIRESAAVVVSWDHVRKDLLRFFDCPDEKIHIMPLPFSQCRLPEPSGDQSAKCQAEYGRFGRFFLYPAQTWEHKNHVGLLKAFEQVVETGEDVALVCTGRRHPDFFSTIERLLKTLRCADRVHFPGYVEDEELSWLYRNTAGVVIPSLYEGGGIPLIEAMQEGAPVICSRTTSFPETMADERFLFDGMNVEEMAEKMLLLLREEAYRRASIENSAARVAHLNAIDLGGKYERLWLEVGQKPGLVGRR